MTKIQFLEHLKEIKNLYIWQIVSLNIIRATKLNSNLKFCPITAVCAELTGDFFDTGLWEKSAEFIGLGKEDARTIIRASDDILYNWFNDKYVPDQLRLDIMEILFGAAPHE